MKNMERWQGKIAIVTGASSGIGLATAKNLVKHGLVVIGLDRQIDTIKNEIENLEGPGEFIAKECDITNEERVIEIFNWIKTTFKSLHILVNNAGIMRFNKITDVPTADLEMVFRVNVFGNLYCTKQAIELMKENRTEAHIINLNSTAGHRVDLPAGMTNNVYPATKHAVTALTETLRNELKDSKIRVTSVSPGPVVSGMFNEAAKMFPGLNNLSTLKPDDVANSIIYALSVPEHVEINDIMLRAKCL